MSAATATGRAVGFVPPNPTTYAPAAEAAPWSPPSPDQFRYVQKSGRNVDASEWKSLTAAERLAVLSHFAVAPSVVEEWEQCRFPHHEPTDGAVVWKAVATSMAELLADRTLPPALATEAYQHLAAHYLEFDKTPPPMPVQWKAAGATSPAFLACRLEVKAVDTEERTFEGLAATWDLDLGMDVIHQGAFKDTVAEWKRAGRALPLLDSHNQFSIFSALGKLVDAKETKAGLWTKWSVIAGDDGDRVLERLRGGVVDSMSIGYMPAKWDFSELDEVDDSPFPRVVRNLRKVDLREVSLVLFPMQPNALVNLSTVKHLAAVRSFEPEERASLESIHTELGRLLSAPPVPPTPAKAAEADDEDPYHKLAHLRVQRLRLTSP